MNETQFELFLLRLWMDGGIKEVYKYKDRIKAFREPLTNIELFTDMTCGKLFEDIEDIANYSGTAPEDYKVNVEKLIEKREGLYEGSICGD